MKRTITILLVIAAMAAGIVVIYLFSRDEAPTYLFLIRTQNEQNQGILSQ